MGLSPRLDMWLGRELWHLLDNSCFYVDHPEQLFHPDIPSRARLNEVVASLHTWEYLRTSRHLGERPVYWIGDALSSSLLPEGTPHHLVTHWESLAQALESTSGTASGLQAAYRDAIALLACLPNTFALSAADADGLPGLISATRKMGLGDVQVGIGDPLAAHDRSLLISHLVASGVQPAVWRLGGLAVIRPFAPGHIVYGDPQEDTPDFVEYETAGQPLAPDASPALIQGLSFYWFTL